MKKKIYALLLLLILALGITPQVVLAQDYRFKLEREDVNLYVNADGTATLEYVLDFVNDAGAHAIDYVDLGLPNRAYDINSVTASVNGNVIADIQKADPDYVEGGIGVTLALGSNAISAGQSGQVQVRVGVINEMLYEADEPENYGSLQFSPNWFGSQYCYGNTDLTVTLFLPPGMNSEEPIYYPPSNKWPGAEEPESGFDDQGRVYYRWHSAEANGYTQYIFGAGFPAQLVPEGVLITEPAFSFNFDALFDMVFPFCFCLMFFGFPAFSVIWGKRQQNKRKMEYLPPKIAIEGHGIKRGLTPVQVAVLAEQPMDKVLTMILFSVVRKGAATVLSRDPIKLEVADPRPEKLRPYEIEFLEAFSQDEKKRKRMLQEMIVNLIKSTSKKMSGFSRKETLAYYEDIMRRAWEQIETADTPDVKMQRFDEAMDWTMLDRNFESRTGEVFRSGPVYIPMWWGRYDPIYRQSSAGGTAASVGTGLPSSPASLPHLPGSDFAASMVNGIQDFSANVVGNLTDFTGGITNKTNPIPKPKSSGGSRRSGGGCACACACAGCACACAGGGR